MRIETKKEKVILREKEAKILIAARELMSYLYDEVENDELIDIASTIVDSLDSFLEPNEDSSFSTVEEVVQNNKVIFINVQL